MKLQQCHGSDYSAAQYTLWSEMLVAEMHDSLDNPPKVPMLRLKRVCGRSSKCSNDLKAALTGMTNSIVATFSLQIPAHPSGSGINSNSPGLATQPKRLGYFNHFLGCLSFPFSGSRFDLLCA